VPMLNQMTWNNQQFMSYERVVRDLGPMGLRFQDRYTIRPQDIIGRFLVQPLASHKLSMRMTNTQQLVNILDRAPIINQMYGPEAVKMPKLLAMILEHGFDIRNVDEIISLPNQNNLLTPTQEHELWYHGNVPPRKPDDNDARHILGHFEEMASERFKLLEQKSPGTASRAKAHQMDHMVNLERKQMHQEDMLQQFAQVGAQMGLMGGGQGGGGSPIGGAAGPEQEPGSPKVRSNETERGEGGPKSEGMRGAPNPGAS
jgi:hypothetical protein